MEDAPTSLFFFPREKNRWIPTFAELFLICLILGLFTHCSPKVSESALPLDPPDEFSYTGQQEQPDEWWTSFRDPQLDSLIEVALDSNLSLVSVWYRLKEAEAVVDRESSYLWPDLEAFVQSQVSYPEPDFVGGENLRMGFRANYEVDLWGRIRYSVEAENYRAEATRWDYQSAAISLAAEIASTWYQLMAAWHQLELSKAQVETNEKILRLIKMRFGTGQVRAVDMLRQEQLIKSSEEQMIFWESRIEVLEHQLAVLTGSPPQEEIIYVPDPLPDLPPLPETGIPTELIKRRPDVQRDFSFLQAADREMASAISAQYPRLNITASVASRANDASALFQDLAYSLGVNLLAPIFYGGRLRAEVDRTEAVKDQRLYEYGQTVLIAFQEVEDALIQEKKQVEGMEVLEERVQLSTDAYEQLQLQYFNGMSDYLAVLTALNQQQQLQRDFISAKQNLVEYRILLYRSLAGGLELDQEE